VVRIYCRITGVLLLAAGVLGLLGVGVPGSLSLNEPGELALHFIAGLIACAVGFGPLELSLAKLYAGVFGVVYLLLAAVGSIQPDLIPGVIHLDVGCNLLHLTLGLWGTFVGIFTPAPYHPPAQVGQAGA
jgi:hypothetical protein